MNGQTGRALKNCYRRPTYDTDPPRGRRQLLSNLPRTARENWLAPPPPINLEALATPLEGPQMTRLAGSLLLSALACLALPTSATAGDALPVRVEIAEG